DAIWRYNPSTDLWVLLTSTPHDTWTAAGGLVGGKLYLFGWERATDVYDITTKSWSTGSALPTGGSCGQPSTSMQAKLYLIGCYDEAGTSNALVFDPALGSWSQAAASPVSPEASTVSRVLLNGQHRLELVGGSRPGNNLQYVP
ncbi:MAG: hypothetical protein ACJ8DJ_04480, partial [Gemmatimonadales bacterium]